MLFWLAYIFKHDDNIWTQQVKLLPSDGKACGYFGCSVSIDGDYAIIGAYGDKDNGKNAGSAYIFKRDGITWSRQVKLLAPDGIEDDCFGCSVSIDGDYAIIGAMGADGNEPKSGSAYVYKNISEFQPPSIPSINGPTNGKQGTPYTFTFTSIDSDGDDVSYYIDWGDSIVQEWVGPYVSGEEVTIKHRWNEQGAYTIKAKTKDVFNEESDWATLQVTMQRGKQSITQTFFKLLEKTIDVFPQLACLLLFPNFDRYIRKY